MQNETVTLKLPRALLSRASIVADKQDVTVGHLVRQLLSKEIERQLNPKTSNRTDEKLVAALQALLAQEMASATGWDDLAVRLADEGYELRPAGGGLTMHKRPCGTRLCKASELGFPYRALVARFRSAMPGHPHGAPNLVFDPPLQGQRTFPFEETPPFEVIDYGA
jgi:hypothetical protein